MVRYTLLVVIAATAAVTEAQHHWGRPGHNPPDHGAGRPWKSKGPWKANHPPWKVSTQASSLSPTSTTSSPATGIGSLPMVDSEELQGSISQAVLSKLAHELEDLAYSTPDRNRVMGSEGHNLTVDWIASKLDELSDYYNYEIQPFTALYSNSAGNLTIDGADQNAEPFEYTAAGSVTADFVAVDNLGCEASDFPDGLDGNIALISRGTCEFGLKSVLAGASGAAAAIIYNNVEGEVGGGTLGKPQRPEGPYVPTAGISQARGQEILDSLAAGETVTGELLIDAATYNITTFNVIAQTIGGDQSQVLTLGAHSDSVEAGPGINDDGSGTVGLLEVAHQLSQYKTNNAVRFCWWSGEEFGLLGSTYYVSQLSNASRAQIPIYLNFDMIASPNYIYAIFDGDGSEFNITGPPGSAEAESFFQSWFTEQGLNYTATAFDGRSDYGSFVEAGIAASGLFTGAEEEKTEVWAEMFGGTAGVALDPNYHQAGDNYTNLNFEPFVVNTKAIAAAVAKYGTSFESLNQGAAGEKRWRTHSLGKRQAAHKHKGKCNHKVQEL